MADRVIWLFIVGLLAGTVITGFGMQLLFMQRLTALEVSLHANIDDHARLRLDLEEHAARLDKIAARLRALNEATRSLTPPPSGP